MRVGRKWREGVGRKWGVRGGCQWRVRVGRKWRVRVGRKWRVRLGRKWRVRVGRKRLGWMIPQTTAMHGADKWVRQPESCMQPARSMCGLFPRGTCRCMRLCLCTRASFRLSVGRLFVRMHAVCVYICKDLYLPSACVCACKHHSLYTVLCVQVSREEPLCVALLKIST